MSKGNRQPAAPPAQVAPTCCGECKYWKPVSEGTVGFMAGEQRGQCTESPPSIIVAPGPVVSYGLTLATLVACGRAK